MSKAALEQMTMSMAAELGHHQVCCYVAPMIGQVD